MNARRGEIKESRRASGQSRVRADSAKSGSFSGLLIGAASSKLCAIDLLPGKHAADRVVLQHNESRDQWSLWWYPARCVFGDRAISVAGLLE